MLSCTGGGGDNITFSTGEQVEDPVVLEVPIAYVKRPVPAEAPDLREPLAFFPGARLLLRERSSLGAEEFDITPSIAGIVAEEEGVDAADLAIDIKGLESSYDGNTLIFSARVVPEPAEDNLELTTWNLWLLDLETRQPRYLVPSRIKRNEGVEYGSGHDIDPHFLGDDRIVFSSTRQVASQARQLNEGRAQIYSALDEDARAPAAVLHIYDPLQREREFRQISFNLSHDLDPVVLASGEIVFSRWNNTLGSHFSLYRVSPSGLQLSPLYGFHSDMEIEFTQPRESDDGSLLSVVKPMVADSLGGDIVQVDAARYADYDQPTWDNRGLGGNGHGSLAQTEIRVGEPVSPGGQYGSVYPLRDGTGRSLVTWSQCRVVSEDGGIVPCTLEPDNTDAAPPLYGAWVYDPAEDTQRPVALAEEGFMISEVVAAEPRDFPDLYQPADAYDPGLAALDRGQLLIDSVYDMDGTDQSPLGISAHARPGTDAYLDRPARFLRILLPVPLPDDEVFEVPGFASGVAGGFAEIAGYTAIEPDGSVTVKLPANRAFRFSILGENGRRVGPRHGHWLQLGAGEILRCPGCHEPGSGLPHGRLDSQPASSNPGARSLDDGTLGFPGTDTLNRYATEPGQSMAQVRDVHELSAGAGTPGRDLLLTVAYRDEWTPEGVQADPEISDRDYDPAWTDIPPGRPIVVDNLDPAQGSRIVINYIDHIQPIWERVRDAVTDSNGVAVDTCVGCHSSASNTVVAAGQLDLGAEPSDLDPDHMRSYRELLSEDAEQWLDAGGNLADRTRTCTGMDEQGNTLTTTETLGLAGPMRAGSASASAAFFACFDGGFCGLPPQPPLPANCEEGDGTVVPATANTLDHRGLLSPSELRLISEWLDIGAQYYNNPFDPRLQQ